MQERLDSLYFKFESAAATSSSMPTSPQAGLASTQGAAPLVSTLGHKSLSLRKSDHETFKDRFLLPSPVDFVNFC